MRTAADIPALTYIKVVRSVTAATLITTNKQTCARTLNIRQMQL